METYLKKQNKIKQTKKSRVQCAQFKGQWKLWKPRQWTHRLETDNILNRVIEKKRIDTENKGVPMYILFLWIKKYPPTKIKTEIIF